MVISYNDGVQVRRSPENAWSKVRDVRLRALRTTPKAFLSTLERESAWSETDWRKSLRDSSWILATCDDVAVGVVQISAMAGSQHECYLEAMWVDPQFRSRSVGRRLVDRAVTQAQQEGAQTVRLAVLDRNATAMGFFKAIGFTELIRTQADIETPMVFIIMGGS